MASTNERQGSENPLRIKELFDMTLEHLDRKSLLDCSAVSKDWNESANKIIYRHMDDSREGSWSAYLRFCLECGSDEERLQLDTESFQSGTSAPLASELDRILH